MFEDRDHLLERLPTYSGVISARLWQGTVPDRDGSMKKRIYIDTDSENGGQHWNGGLGYRICYIDLVDDCLVAQGEAGAKTRNALRPTLDRIAEDFGLTLIIR
jgi:hypothetical protein